MAYYKRNVCVIFFLCLQNSITWFGVDTHLVKLVHFRDVDVGEASEPFRVSSRSLPNSTSRDFTAFFVISQAGLVDSDFLTKIKFVFFHKNGGEASPL